MRKKGLESQTPTKAKRSKGSQRATYLISLYKKMDGITGVEGIGKKDKH